MKRYFLKNGKEVKVGDVLSLMQKSSSPTSESTTVDTFTVTEGLLPLLAQSGIVTAVIDKPKSKDVNTDLMYYVAKIARKQGWSINRTVKYLNITDGVYTAAVFTILLKEIAIELDKKYPDHIRNSKEIFVVSMVDGKVHKIEGDINKDGNFYNFAAFRSKEDALIACDILKGYLEAMFNNDNKQKD
jgi:hypothetical protein